MTKRKKKKQRKEAKDTRIFFSWPMKNKILLVLGCAVVLVLACVLIVHLFLPNGVVPDYRPPAVTLEFDTLSRTEAAVDPDKDEAFYQQTVRDILYTYGGQTVLLTDENYDDREDQGKFFKEYMDSLKAGSWESYQRFFADGYFNNNETKEGMNPQRLYDIEIVYHSESKGIVLEGKSYDVENFTVKYKIFANDGSFRNDIFSDVWKPQIYQIAETEGGYRIVNIINVLSA